MISELKNIANQIANSRVRLLYYHLEKETVSEEIKCMEGIEYSLRQLINELEEKIKALIE